MSYKHALLVDDDPVFRALAEDMFLDAGMAEVETADDGNEALHKLDAGLAPDLLVCDLNMPAHDGVSLIRALADRQFPGKVLIISGEANSIIESVAKLARMQGLNIIGSIRKPLSVAGLEAVISRVAPSPKQAEQPRHADPLVLDAAIVGSALHPFYQAKVSMANCIISGAEALVRIGTTPTQLASPMPYIELAERNNRIDDLTITLTRMVAKHVKTFSSNGAPLPVSINISPISLQRRDFPDLLAATLEAAGLPCSQVTLEVTETRLVEYGPDALEVLSRMRIKGFGLSVDDFGTGYSNIDRLQMYPFSELKIDQSFTRHALSDGFSRASVEMSVRLAKEMGLKIVAEGVETVEMWNFLADLGVDEAQGYLMAKPMAPEPFAELLSLGMRTF